MEELIEMVKEMLETGSASSIANASGVNQITIGKIKNGKADKVNSKTMDRLTALHEDWKAGNVELPKRKKRGSGAGGASTGTRVPKGLTIDQQIAQKEKELENIQKIQDEIAFLKKKKQLQDKHNAEIQALQAEHKEEMDALEAEK
jgi:hypothetical protein